MWIQTRAPVALALGGDGVVEVARGGRVDGEGRQRGEVAARAAFALGPLAPLPALRPRSSAGSRGSRAPPAAAPRPSPAPSAARGRRFHPFGPCGARSVETTPRRRLRRPRPRPRPGISPTWPARTPSARCSASSTVVCGSSCDLDVGVDAVALGQVDPVRGEVLADRQLQRAAVGEVLLLLEDALAVGAGADHGRRRASSASAAVRISAAEAVPRSIRTTSGSSGSGRRRRSCGRCRPGCASWSRPRLRPRAGRRWRSAPPRRAGRRGCRAGRGRSLPPLPSRPFRTALGELRVGAFAEAEHADVAELACPPTFSTLLLTLGSATSARVSVSSPHLAALAVADAERHLGPFRPLDLLRRLGCCSAPAIDSPSTETIVSPASIPASSAGEPGKTLADPQPAFDLDRRRARSRRSGLRSAG